LLCARAFSGSGGLLSLFAAASLLLGCFNLLPAQPLDGWRILSSFLKNEKTSEFISLATALLAAALGSALFVFTGSISLLFTGGILALRQSVMYNNKTY
ncbi:MAG: site-2 protease family protein, partial [Oscillospiraceae bacterium]|nr:site-2 protease family protein [Oscillospiraceae bacterium]